LESCTPLLEKHRYACFSDASHSSEEGENLNNVAKVLGSPPVESDSEEFDLVQVLAKSDTGQLISKPIKVCFFILYFILFFTRWVAHFGLVS
jgi:hypothetical protein